MTLPEHLYGFQAEDAPRLAAQGPHLLLLPQGTGKSVITIAAADTLDPFVIVVVCPAIMRADWQAKFTRFARRNFARAAHLPGRLLLVLSYEEIHTPKQRADFIKTLPGGRIDILVLDEGQRLKNPHANVTASIYGERAEGRGLAALAAHVWVLSGTICPNHWGELYTHVRSLFPQRLPRLRGAPMRYWDFLDRYTVWEPSGFGERIKVLGNKNQDELRAMVQGIAIRREREEVDKLLPLLTVDTVLLPDTELDRQAYQELIESKEGQRLQAVVAQAVTMEDIWHETSQLATARRLLGELKAATVARYVRQLLEGDAQDAILVFAHHKSVMRRIASDLRDIEPHVFVIDSDTPEDMRAMAIERFQQGGARVLVLGIGTAREGITLTAANRVVMAEAAWTPAYNEQCIKRAHRIGQLHPVLAEFVCIHNTLDQAVMDVCVRKSGLLAEIN